MDVRATPSDLAGRPATERPQSGAGWMLLFLIAVNLFNVMDRYILAAAEKPIEGALLAGDPHAKQKFGWLTTAFLVAYMLLSPVFGWLGDRWSRWRLIGIGVILWSLASGASGLALTFAVMLVTRMFVGVGEAAYGPVAPSVISDLYPVSARSRVLSWFYIALPVGGALGYLLGGWFAGHGAWRWAFYAVVPPGIVLGLVALFLRDPPRGRSERNATPHRARPADYFALLRIPSYVLNTLGMAAMTFAIGGMATWMPRFIQEKSAAGPGPTLGEERVGIIFGAITALGGLLGTLAGGWLGDRLRRRWTGAYFTVSGAGLLAGFAALLAFLYTPFPAAWGLLFMAVFFTFFNNGPSNAVLANVTHPSVRASAFALNILAIHVLGDVPSPPLMGAIADRCNGDLRPSFLLVSGMMLVGGVIWLWGARYLQHDTELAPVRV